VAVTPPEKESDMKTRKYAFLKTAVALTFGFSLATFAHDENPGMMQRAAANHFEMRKPAPAASHPTTGGTSTVSTIGGKHAAQIAESRRPAGTEKGLDVVHAPRPVTASKDPNFEAKWRENARQFQVAPIK